MKTIEISEKGTTLWRISFTKKEDIVSFTAINKNRESISNSLESKKDSIFNDIKSICGILEKQLHKGK